MAIRLQKRTKVARAVQAPRASQPKVRIQKIAPTPTGGTQAPRSTAVRGNEVRNRTQPRSGRIGVGQAKVVPSAPVTPPAVPPPPPPSSWAAASGTLPETPRAAQRRREAAAAWNTQSSDLNYKLYLAALAYGDPGIVKAYGDVVPTPGGALQTIEREEGEANKQNALAHNSNNTFFSGMNLQDVRKIGDDASLSRKSALDKWSEAQHDLSVALTEAEEARNHETGEADQEDLIAAEEAARVPGAEAPEPQPPSSGGGGGSGGKGKKAVVKNTPIKYPASTGVGPNKPVSKQKKGK